MSSAIALADYPLVVYSSTLASNILD